MSSYPMRMNIAPARFPSRPGSAKARYGPMLSQVNGQILPPSVLIHFNPCPIDPRIVTIF